MSNRDFSVYSLHISVSGFDTVKQKGQEGNSKKLKAKRYILKAEEVSFWMHEFYKQYIDLADSCVDIESKSSKRYQKLGILETRNSRGEELSVLNFVCANIFREKEEIHKIDTKIYQVDKFMLGKTEYQYIKSYFSYVNENNYVVKDSKLPIIALQTILVRFLEKKLNPTAYLLKEQNDLKGKIQVLLDPKISKNFNNMIRSNKNSVKMIEFTMGSLSKTRQKEISEEEIEEHSNNYLAACGELLEYMVHSADVENLKLDSLFRRVKVSIEIDDALPKGIKGKLRRSILKRMYDMSQNAFNKGYGATLDSKNEDGVTKLISKGLVESEEVDIDPLDYNNNDKMIEIQNNYIQNLFGN